MPEAIDGGGEDDGGANEDALEVGAHTGDVAAGPKKPKHQNAKHTSENRSFAAEQAGAADDDRGDNSQLRALEFIRHGATETRGGHHPRNSRGLSGHDVAKWFSSLDSHAAQA